eukprot:12773725-Alexandrium_andersonii.AAC.1
MSASLVGSEMCIRDSGHAPQPRRARPRCWGICGAWPLRPQRSQHPPWKPVSYTHLTLPTICSV